ncbi:hypothetical protein JW872_00400 [Candidatus Babeliales bacterium]|nr:hypothetical protein [Candidatus Babeliales bacterium]
MKHFRLVVLVLASCNLMASKTSIYSSIASQYLTILTGDSLNGPQVIASGSDPELEHLSEAEKSLAAFKILSTTAPVYLPGTAIIDPSTWENLELFMNANLLGTVKRTRTKLGELTLAKMLAEPTINVRELHRRQRIIKALSDNEALFRIIDDALATIQECEDTLLSFWKEESGFNRETFSRFYFADWFSGSATMNKTSSLLNSLRRGEDFAMVLTLPLALMYIRYQLNNNIFKTLSDNFTVLKQDTVAGRVIKRVATDEQIAHWFPGDELRSDRLFHVPGELKFNSLCNFSYRAGDFAAGIINVLLSGYQIATYFALSHRSHHYLYAKLKGLASSITSIHTMHDVIKVHQDSLRDLYECQVLTNLFDHPETTSDDLQMLLEHLESMTFKRSFSYFSDFGKILAANKLIDSAKYELTPALETIGTIDAFMSLARLLREFESQRVHYCFAEFVNSKNPYINLQNFWNPMISSKMVVPNSIELGHVIGGHNIILTGQNTGGKSTILKGITLCTILAQTCGIVPADTCILTPFASINTYMNITDKVQEGLSLFAAEVHRAKSLLEKITRLGPDEKSFSMIDEAFKGTGGEAQELSYWYAQKLGTFPNSICMNATHYPKLTVLEDELPGIYQNYKVEVKILADGTLMRPYKLERGETLHNIAQHILHEQGLL